MLFTHRDERILDEAARRATQFAKAEDHKEEQKHRREVNLSYDDLESEEDQSFLSFNATKVVGYSIAAAIFLVTLFFYLTK